MEATGSPSLYKRLLIATGVALIAFLGITGLVLDAAFRDSAEAALRDRLQGHVYALLAAAELNARTGGLRLPASLPDARFSRPGSGLYAAVFGSGFHWRSDSVLGVELPWVRHLEPGEVRFAGPISTPQGAVYRLAYGVAWETGEGELHPFTFNVIEDLTRYSAQVSRFRQTLWFWLGASALLLVILQVLLLRWSLRPLRRISRELHAVESGEQGELEGRYPVELAGFKQHLNRFLAVERERLARYRHTLSDLAHSLKTPLAVLRGGLESEHLADREKARLREQVDRMDDIVAWRLKRAARAGGRTLGVTTPVAPVADQLVRALEKVHAERGIDLTTDVSDNARFPGEEGDLYELLGNLLDNAFKWADGSVHLHAAGEPGLVLVVADDGPGIEPDRVDELLRRGQRGDELKPGQGLGLAMVDEIVRSCDGTLDIGRSSSGGCRVRVELPAG